MVGGLSLGLPADPPPYFLNARDVNFVVVDGEQRVSPQTIARAKEAKECRPAELDPEGNWGSRSAGGQLGLRLVKTQFTNEEPIMVTFYTRNVGTESLSWRIQTPGTKPFGLVVVKDGEREAMLTRGEEAELRRFGKIGPSIYTGSKVSHVSPGQQDQYEFPLHRQYNFTRPGRYFVSGTVELVHDSRGQPKGSIMSGTSMFEIVAVPGSTADTNKPVSPRPNVNPGSSQPLPPAKSLPPPTASANATGSNTTSGNATQNQTQAAPNQSKSNDAKSVETGNEPLSSPRRNLLWSGALAGLVLFGVLGFWLLRRRKA